MCLEAPHNILWLVNTRLRAASTCRDPLVPGAQSRIPGRSLIPSKTYKIVVLTARRLKRCRRQVEIGDKGFTAAEVWGGCAQLSLLKLSFIDLLRDYPGWSVPRQQRLGVHENRCISPLVIAITNLTLDSCVFEQWGSTTNVGGGRLPGRCICNDHKHHLLEELCWDR